MDKMIVRVPVAVKAKVTEDLKLKIVGDLQNIDTLMGAEILTEDGKIIAFRE